MASAAPGVAGGMTIAALEVVALQVEVKIEINLGLHKGLLASCRLLEDNAAVPLPDTWVG
eukprot:scaffold99647_cov45-Phaeocystis_antarctica.AAC.3